MQANRGKGVVRSGATPILHVSGPHAGCGEVVSV